MARIGTSKHPAILRVQTQRRAEQVMDICDEYDVHYIIGVEPDKDEDLSDLERALNPPQPVRVEAKPGRNDPCPCGSGRKAKRCCPELTL